jgi:hypothetical protein
MGGILQKVTAVERIDLLVDTIKEEIQRVPTQFEVRLVQLWYDRAYPVFASAVDRVAAVSFIGEGPTRRFFLGE